MSYQSSMLTTPNVRSACATVLRKSPIFSPTIDPTVFTSVSARSF